MRENLPRVCCSVTWGVPVRRHATRATAPATMSPATMGTFVAATEARIAELDERLAELTKPVENQGRMKRQGARKERLDALLDGLLPPPAEASSLAANGALSTPLPSSAFATKTATPSSGVLRSGASSRPPADLLADQERLARLLSMHRTPHARRQTPAPSSTAPRQSATPRQWKP